MRVPLSVRLASAVAVICAGCACLPAVAPAEPPVPRTVVGVYWSAENFPSNQVSDASIREVFQSRPDLAIDYFSEYLESDLFPDGDATLAFRDYLLRKFRGRRIDLVVAESSVSLRFVLEHRAELFPGIPIVYYGADGTELRALTPRDDVTGVVNSARYGDTLALALKLHPSTRRVYVVAQAPGLPILPEVELALAPYRDRVQLTYLTEASTGALLDTVKTISGRSLILQIRASSEDPGFVLFPADVAKMVGETATVPVYGIMDGHLGTGIVGGVMHETGVAAGMAAAMAIRVLDGTRPQEMPFVPARLGPVFDWRQLQRWGIKPSRLPPDSRILFREPSVWEEYRWPIIGMASVVVLQALLIAGLLALRARRRRAQAVLKASEAALRRSYERIRELAGQLISTREVERSRIARELHDNVGQQMALLSIDIDLLERESSVGERAARRVRSLAKRVGDISTDVRDLSQWLHPSKLETLGLVSALQALCRETAALYGVKVDLQHQAVPRDVPHDAALSLFRIAQEALHNVAKHSGAGRATVSLSRAGDVLQLDIADSGRGFVAGDIATHGLGLLSMRERAHLLGGELAIDTAPGRGTKVTVRLTLVNAHLPASAAADPGLATPAQS